MKTALVLFTRDLRVHDQAALATAAREAERVVPLFVFDERLIASRCAAPNRLAFLLDCLADLDRSLRERGGLLVVRRGDVVRETLRLARSSGAEAIFLSEDVSAYARRRHSRLREACERERIELRTFPGVTVVPAGALTPSGGGDHYRVFTPYWRAWSALPRFERVAAPRHVRPPEGIRAGSLPSLKSLLGSGAAASARSPELPVGGEHTGRTLLKRWMDHRLAEYEERHDDLAADRTSHLSPYLHFGCLSPVTVLARGTSRSDASGGGSGSRSNTSAGGDAPGAGDTATNRPGTGAAGAEAFARQLCWRDFHHQVLAARPEMPYTDYRSRGDRWRRSKRLAEAWREGRTGYPIVDAGMRQLAREGFMHNRARLLVASFLTKTLYLDWRVGAAHFEELLVDADLANNVGNWQWVAGTGNDTRPNRVLNPIRQAHRFDRDGDYVRRYVPELGAIAGRAAHEPWLLPGPVRRDLDYPKPVVDHMAAAEELRHRRE
jgi:deoxyribodipyrimidine photo-lyase